MPAHSLLSLNVASLADPIVEQPLDFTALPETARFKVLLVYPNVRHPEYPIESLLVPHLGLAVLSACARRIGACTELCDLTTVPPPLWPEVFRCRLRRSAADLVAITAGSMQWPYVRPLIGICRAAGTAHVVGGPHATAHPESVIETADVLVAGEGEGAFMDIIRALAKGSSPAGIANTWVRTGDGGVVRRERRNLIEDLDALPFPDWPIFHPRHFRPRLMSWSRDRRPGPTAILATIEGSRGCPYQCAYCSNTANMRDYHGKGRWRREKSPQRMVEELKSFRELAGGLDRVHWVDEVFVTSVARLRLFSELYRREIAVPYAITERPENITPEKLSLLAESGLYGVAIGFESGDAHLRRAVLNRRTREDALRQAFLLPRRHGVRTFAFTMVGLPGQDERSMLLTWRFLRQVKPDGAQFTIFRPMRGTELYDECIRRGLHDPANDEAPWDLRPIIRHDLLNDDTIVRYQRMLAAFATRRGVFAVLAFHAGRRWNWACARLLRWQSRRQHRHGDGAAAKLWLHRAANRLRGLVTRRTCRTAVSQGVTPGC